MAVGADFAIDVEIVKLDEITGQFVVVGRYIFGKQAERRVAITLRQISQHLIVGAVFLDDVNTVTNRTLPTDPGGDRIVGRAGWGSAGPAGARWTTPTAALGELTQALLESFATGKIDDADRALE